MEMMTDVAMTYELQLIIASCLCQRVASARDATVHKIFVLELCSITYMSYIVALNRGTSRCSVIPLVTYKVERFGPMVTAWRASTKLLDVEPG